MFKNLLAAVSFVAITLLILPVLSFNHWDVKFPSDFQNGAANDGGNFLTGVINKAQNAMSDTSRSVASGFETARESMTGWVGIGGTVGAQTGNAAKSTAGSIATTLGGS